MLKFLRIRKRRDPTPQDAIQKIADSEAFLNRKIEYLELKQKQQVETARALASTKKSMALKALKKKKRIEKQLETFYGALTNLEAQRGALESSVMNVEIIKTMEEGSLALKGGLKNVGGVDKIHDVIDDVAEQIDAGNEIAETLGTALLHDCADEDELMSELNELIEEPINYATEPLPQVPSGDEIIPNKRELKGTRGLDESMALLAQWAS